MIEPHSDLFKGDSGDKMLIIIIWSRIDLGNVDM